MPKYQKENLEKNSIQWKFKSRNLPNLSMNNSEYQIQNITDLKTLSRNVTKSLRGHSWNGIKSLTTKKIKLTLNERDSKRIESNPK